MHESAFASDADIAVAEFGYRLGAVSRSRRTSRFAPVSLQVGTSGAQSRQPESSDTSAPPRGLKKQHVERRSSMR